MDYQVVGLVFGALVFILGGLATLYKFMGAIRKERELENGKILQTSREYTDQKYQALEQDLAHQKDMHEGKIAELSQKIDELKDEMSKHHAQLMDFLIKSIQDKQ